MAVLLREVNIVTKHGERRAESAPEDTDWNAIYRRLVAYGIVHHRLSLEDAEQVAQEALGRFFDPAYAAYDPQTHNDLLRFLRSTVNGIVVNQHRRQASSADWFVRSVGLVETEPSPEDYAIAAEHAHIVLEKLTQRTAADPLARRIIATTLDGIHGATEQAETLGVSIEEVYRARRRIKDYLAAVVGNLGGN